MVEYIGRRGVATVIIVGNTARRDHRQNDGSIRTTVPIGGVRVKGRGPHTQPAHSSVLQHRVDLSEDRQVRIRGPLHPRQYSHPEKQRQQCCRQRCGVSTAWQITTRFSEFELLFEESFGRIECGSHDLGEIELSRWQLERRIDEQEAVYVITQYIAISKFGDALGVALEPVFQGGEPILHVDHAG